MEIPLLPGFVPAVNSKKRWICLIGGRGSGKSQFAASLCLARMMAGQSVLCAREFQNSIHESSHSLLTSLIEELELPGFEVGATEIKHSSGGRCFYRGLARNPQSIKSLARVQFVFVDESQTLSDESLRVLLPTIRAAGSQLMFCANPGSQADAFYQRFVSPVEETVYAHGEAETDMSLVLLRNYDSNPMFPEVLRQELENDRKTLPSAMFDHIWLGRTLDSVDNSVIDATWFDAAVGLSEHPAFAQLSGVSTVGFDPAGGGSDAAAAVLRRGPKVIDFQLNVGGDFDSNTDFGLDFCDGHEAQIFVYDGDGLGAGVGREARRRWEGARVEVKEFRGGQRVSSPDSIEDGKPRKDRFFNSRGEAYAELRRRFMNSYRLTLGEFVEPADCITIPEDHHLLGQLRSEVCRIPLKSEPGGRFQVMPKSEMLRIYKIPSPNLADSLAYAFWPDGSSISTRDPRWDLPASEFHCDSDEYRGYSRSRRGERHYEEVIA